MASLRSIRKRIQSVKNTRQLTRAMKMVSGAKLRRATDAALAARPYSTRLRRLVGNLIEAIEEPSHPLLQGRENVSRMRVVVFSSDRGLCGSFNSNVLRVLDTYMREQTEGREVGLVTIGKKGRDHAKRRRYEVSATHIDVQGPRQFELARELAQELLHDYQNGTIDGAVIIYNQFKSAMTQVGVLEPLLPLNLDDLQADSGLVDFTYEPAEEQLLDMLLPRLVENRIQQALLESTASEHAARMLAMDNATRNASELIDRLTLEYNRARQAAITKELVEIVSGAEAL